jgi:hypothetical protein
MRKGADLTVKGTSGRGRRRPTSIRSRGLRRRSRKSSRSARRLHVAAASTVDGQPPARVALMNLPFRSLLADSASVAVSLWVHTPIASFATS